jgi:hypothetical protein
VRTSDLKAGPGIRFKRRLRAFTATPSGDRLYIALDSTNELRVIDRYSGSENAAISLPGPAAELRMDSLGRYLLVRPARVADSAWVVALGTGRVTGKVKTAWSADLPFVGVDGSVVVSQPPDVVLVDPETLAPRRTVAGGALDFWIPIRWSGFRPRAAGLDQPVTFPGAAPDSGDSILSAIRRSQSDTSLHPPATPQTTTGRTAPAPDSSVAPRGGAAEPGTASGSPAHSPLFTVQLAAVLNGDSARARASRIVVGGQRAHVVTANRGGATVFLVVLGPYPSRDAAEAAGRQSAQPNPWIYEGVP